MYHDSTNAPSLEKSVLDRLKRMDPNTKLTFSRFVIDPKYGAPMPMKPKPYWQDERQAALHGLHRIGGQWLLEDPAWHLWARSGNGRWYLIKSYPASQGFGHREVQALEGDAARWMKPSEIVAKAERIQHERIEQQKAKYQDVRREVIKANETRIADYLGGKQDSTRDGKLFSFSGQKRRGSTGRIRKTAEEDGWVRATPEDYR